MIATIDRKENDYELRGRLCALLPEGAWYSAGDLGNASGEQLDRLATSYKTERRTITEEL
jgi:hypothetical protein